jgi:hypothetical protein
MVCLSQRWQVEATGLNMSGPIEVINIKEMSCILLEDGEIIATYKVEKCDKCESIRRLDDFGYQKNVAGEKILWFCGECR